MTAEIDLCMAMRIVQIIVMDVPMGILVALVVGATDGPASEKVSRLLGYNVGACGSPEFNFVNWFIDNMYRIKIPPNPRTISPGIEY